MKTDSLLIILTFFRWTGIVTSVDSGSCNMFKKCMQYFYPIVSVLTVVDVIIMASVHVSYDPSKPQAIISYALLTTHSVVVWYALRRTGDSFNDIVQAMIDFKRPYVRLSKKNVVLKIILFLNFMNDFFLSALGISNQSQIERYCKRFTYHVMEKCENTYSNIVYFFLKHIFLIIVSSSFCNAIAIAYCYLCYRCYVLLSSYRKHVQRLASMDTKYLLKTELGNDYRKLRKIVNDIQLGFSLPSLIVLIISFLQAFGFLALLVLQPSKLSSVFLVFETICVRVSTGIFALLIPCFSVQIFLETRRNKDTFNEVYADIVFHSSDHTSPENLHVLYVLKEMEPIKFSASGMVEFTGGTMLAILGTLLTYGLLILNVNS